MIDPDQEIRNIRQGSVNRWLDGDLGTFYLEIMMKERKKEMPNWDEMK